MSTTSTGHPGPYIRRHVLPKGLTVTKAAKSLGVGRVALTNMLNGKASLSEAMAGRLAETFGANAEELFRMQEAFNHTQGNATRSKSIARVHVPALFEIRARQIQTWADMVSARDHLPALLRKLVVTTGTGLSKADFSAFDNAQRHGWDGFVLAERATPWIPAGASGWEFGVNKDPNRKAEGDYTARSEAISETARQETTFVFVTPRNWPGKTKWAADKRAERNWRDVRAYDASDLEQWLETSIPAQVWFIELLDDGIRDVRSLERCWLEWANVSKPRLVNSLFSWAVQAFTPRLERWLETNDADPLVVTADSREEALAGLYCLFASDSIDRLDRVVVVSSSDQLSRIAAEQSDIITVLDHEDAQRASGVQHGRRMILVTNRNLPSRLGNDDREEIRFGLVPPDAFRAALESLRLEGGKDRIEQLVEATGRSLTVLRRRLSDVPAVQVPPWAEDTEKAGRLIPLAFLGAWKEDSEADMSAVATMSGVDEKTVQAHFSDLLAMSPAPVWAVERHRGVLSQVDVFYAVHRRVTQLDMDRFFTVADAVLGERDPSLDLSEKDRWAAAIYDKSRRHSSALQMGIAGTLVWLSVHGDGVFRHLGGDLKARVGVFIRKLLTPFNEEKWLSQKAFLMTYAEAAPDVFLEMLKEDLERPEPALHALMKPVSGKFGESPARSELLWALEGLAWNPATLGRVVDILGELAKIPLDDNWVNKPENSLSAIFRAWMPQTAAPVSKRNALLKRLVRKSPDVAWRLCVDQFDLRSKTGRYSHRPKWREDAVGHGEVSNHEERTEVASAAFDLAIGWQNPDTNKLGDLIKRLAGLPEPMAESIWGAMDRWLDTNPDDWQKAVLHEKLRTTFLTSRGRASGFDHAMRERALDTMRRLEPTDLLAKHDWLFTKAYVEYSADELEDDGLDYEARDRWVLGRRITAIREIWHERGFDGIADICTRAEEPGVVGWTFSRARFSDADQRQVVNEALALDAREERQSMSLFLSGLLRGLVPDHRATLLREYVANMKDGELPWEQCLRLLTAAPFEPATWSIGERLTAEQRRAYWSSVPSERLFDAGSKDLEQVIECLRIVDRPRSAFWAIQHDVDKVSSSVLMDLLRDVALGGNEHDREIRLDSHAFSDVFTILSDRADVPRHDLAMLEFAYAEVLAVHTEHGIRNLEAVLVEDPNLFIQLLAFAFNRKDQGEDLPHLRAPNEASREILAARAHEVLTSATRTPGSGDDGTIDSRILVAWIEDVRRLAKACARSEIADCMVGQLLGRCSTDPYDGIWPHVGVREALEEIGTPALLSEIEIGRLNTRGVVSRGEGGDQERELAAMYRGWAQAVDDLYPATARLLSRLANSYEHEARAWDNEHEVRQRLRGW